ncbi:hypothetical protein [Protofrankia sp. BMG5.30]|uniref:hypothetical protein n=1 Tax=Protofrankia sp. BMG5.30 TaxID=1834514 RepID=UPI003529E818
MHDRRLLDGCLVHPADSTRARQPSRGRRSRWVRQHHTGTLIPTLHVKGARPMPIIPPAHGPWRTPSGQPPFVTVRRSHTGDWEVTVRPGADPVDVSSALVALPVDTVFTEALGDVDIILIFRMIPGSPALLPKGIGNPPVIPAMR